MKLKLSLEEAKAKALGYLRQDCHCGPTVMMVMQEVYGIENGDFRLAGTAFFGGLGGQQRATCGALSAAAACLGLRYRCPPGEQEKAEAWHKFVCDNARQLADNFIKVFGAATCLDLVGVELIDDEAVMKAKESGPLATVCPRVVQFLIEQLYAIEESHDTAPAVEQRTS